MSIKTKIAKQIRRRRFRVRNAVKAANRAGKPRVSVYRSNRFISVQIIDDSASHTVVGMSSRALGAATGDKKEQAKQLGLALAKQALEKNVSEVVFDRGSYLYHGRVKALAEGLREGGLSF